MIVIRIQGLLARRRRRPKYNETLEAQETALGDPVLEGCLLASARSFFWGGEPRVGPGLSMNWVCFTPKTPSARELRRLSATAR